MPITIKIALDPANQAAAEALIGALVDKIENRAGLLKGIADTLLANTQDRFHSETDPQGNKWKENAPLTKALKKGGSILRVRGRLMGSINRDVSGDTIAIGPNTEYAAAQQFGVTITAKNGPFLLIPFKKGAPVGKDGAKKKKGGKLYGITSVTIPARPYIGIGKDDEQAISDIAEEWFTLK